MIAAAPEQPARAEESPLTAELGALFHRLANQLGVVLAYAELLEARAGDEVQRERAAQIVASILAAMATTREIRNQADLLG